MIIRSYIKPSTLRVFQINSREWGVKTLFPAGIIQKQMLIAYGFLFTTSGLINGGQFEGFEGIILLLLQALTQ